MIPIVNRLWHVLVACVVLAAVAMEPAAATANIMPNGSFEDASQSPPYATELRLAAGSRVITGWTVTGGGVDYMGPRWAPSDGQRSVDMNKDAPGGLTCDALTTVPGEVYDLLFDMAGNPDPAPALRTMAVSINSVEAGSFSFDATGVTATDMRWQQMSLRFTATSTSTTIAFVSTTAGTRGPMLDNVRLYEGNTAPTAPTSVTITPGAPRGGMSLLAEASGSTDADEDSVTYTYVWQVSLDGGAHWTSRAPGDTVPGTAVVRGQIWRVRVTATDGIATSDPFTSARVTIINGRPTPPTSISIGTLNPRIGFGLVGRCDGGTDPDGDIIAYRWRWWKSLNGTDWQSGPGGRRLPMSSTQPGEYWRVAARTADGATVSDWSYSEPIHIGAFRALGVTATAAAHGPATAVTVSLTAAATVQMTVRNMAGRMVAAPAPQSLPAGVSTLLWNGQSALGTRVPSGSYLVEVRAVAEDGTTAKCLVSLRL